MASPISPDRRKPVLYWTIFRTPWNYFKRTHVVLAVTSSGPGRRINGRLPDDTPTHTTTECTTGKFASETEAAAIVDRIAEIREKYEELRAPLLRENRRLDAEEDNAIKDLLNAP